MFVPWRNAQGLPKHMPAPEPLQKDWSQELKAAELPEQQPQTQGACALSPWNVHEGAAAHVAASNMCREKETATASEPAAVETREDPRVFVMAKAASVATPWHWDTWHATASGPAAVETTEDHLLASSNLDEEGWMGEASPCTTPDEKKKEETDAAAVEEENAMSDECMQNILRIHLEAGDSLAADADPYM